MLRDAQTCICHDDSEEKKTYLVQLSDECVERVSCYLLGTVHAYALTDTMRVVP